MVKKTGDTIQFEYRMEVDAVCNALETYLKEHGNDENRETIEEMTKMLDKMYMNW